MKRDPDIIRNLLLVMEADIGTPPKTYALKTKKTYALKTKKTYALKTNAQEPFLEGYTNQAVYEHFLMLLASPFIEGKQYLSGEILVQRITWKGREFIDAIRGENVWAKTKAGAEKIGSVGLGFVWEIAKGVVKHELKSTLGIDVA